MIFYSVLIAQGSKDSYNIIVWLKLNQIKQTKK